MKKAANTGSLKQLCRARKLAHSRLLALAGSPCASLLVLAVLGLGGCAGMASLGSPMEADLPLDPVVEPYPTAIGAPKSVEIAHANTQQEPPAENAEPQDDQPAGLPATPLAAVPPHLRATEPGREPIPLTNPQSQAAPPAVPVTPPLGAAQAAPPAPVPITVPLSAGPNVVQPLPLPDVTSAIEIKAEPEAPAVAVAEAEAEVNTDQTEPAIPHGDRQAAIDSARNELIASLEAEIRQRRTENNADQELPRLEQQLRLLYLAAERIDDAVTGVESLDLPQREAFKHVMFGLGVWLSPDEARRAPLRSAKVLRSLREATLELSTASKLELSSPVFCERVDQFGWFNEFPRNEFRPKQQVILYVEVENFAAEKKGNSYETELQGSYQIFDAGGRIVAERQLPLDREVCRNYRRDYFLAYPMYLPDAIEPGRYRLELTVEDLKASGDYQGRKFGEGMIEFTIRQ